MTVLNHVIISEFASVVAALRKRRISKIDVSGVFSRERSSYMDLFGATNEKGCYDTIFILGKF